MDFLCIKRFRKEELYIRRIICYMIYIYIWYKNIQISHHGQKYLLLYVLMYNSCKYGLSDHCTVTSLKLHKI